MLPVIREALLCHSEWETCDDSFFGFVTRVVLLLTSAVWYLTLKFEYTLHLTIGKQPRHMQLTIKYFAWMLVISFSCLQFSEWSPRMTRFQSEVISRKLISIHQTSWTNATWRQWESIPIQVIASLCHWIRTRRDRSGCSVGIYNASNRGQLSRHSEQIRKCFYPSFKVSIWSPKEIPSVTLMQSSNFVTQGTIAPRFKASRGYQLRPEVLRNPLALSTPTVAAVPCLHWFGVCGKRSVRYVPAVSHSTS